MTDVVTKIRSSLDTKEGTAVVHVTKQGTITTLDVPGTGIDISNTETKLTDRFDDPTYYG